MEDPQPGGRHGLTIRRGSALGSVLIVLGVALLGAALSAAAAGPRGPASRAAHLTPPPHRVATPAGPPAPPAIEARPSPPPRPTPTASAPAGTPSPAASAPTPTPAPTPVRKPPATRLRMPSIGVDTPVVEVDYDLVTIEGVPVMQWQVADYAAGHHRTSANPGEDGNIVISGHDDWRGEVFRDLPHLALGDPIILVTPEGEHRYAVAELVYRKDTGAPLAERLATGQFLSPMPEERVTLVTCWPYGIDDHRLIVIAKPARP